MRETGASRRSVRGVRGGDGWKVCVCGSTGYFTTERRVRRGKVEMKVKVRERESRIKCENESGDGLESVGERVDSEES